jgi:uncharacterized membrane protein
MADPPDRHGLAMKRLAGALAIGAAVFVAALLLGANWGVEVTAGWTASAFVIVSAVWLGIGRLTAPETRARAQSEDFSRTVSDLVVLSASTASLVAVGFILIRAGNHHGADKALLILLAIVSVALSWATVHTLYAVRYGDLYYQGETVGGIDFPGGEAPDYRDFAYLAFTIGMTFQVSDTNLSTRAIRRTATRHALLSYLFGAVIVALAINTVSSLLH